MDGPRGAHISAEGLGLKGPRGWAFRGMDLQAEPGSLIAVEGPSGSGRTCLLLALSGRMRTTEGSAEVDGLPCRASWPPSARSAPWAMCRESMNSIRR